MARTITTGTRVLALRPHETTSVLDYTGVIIETEPREADDPWVTILFGDGETHRTIFHTDRVEVLTEARRAWSIAARPDLDMAATLARADEAAAAALAAYHAA